jgi:hypothetical protein
VRGRLITVDPQAFALSVQSVEQRHGQILTWKGEPVTLRREYVATVQERRVSKSRLALLAGASVVGIVATVAALTNWGFGSGSAGGGGPPR